MSTVLARARVDTRCLGLVSIVLSVGLGMFGQPGRSSRNGRVHHSNPVAAASVVYVRNHGSINHQATLPAAPAVSENYVSDLDNAQHWNRFPVTVAVHSDAVVTRERESAIFAGFNQWVSATGSQVSYRLVSDPSKADIVVECDLGRDRSVTNSEYDRQSLQITHANIHIGLAEPEHPGRTVTLEDVKSLAAHEFGHALGLDGHSTDPHDLMYPVLDNNRAVTRRDVNTLHLAYEAI